MSACTHTLDLKKHTNLLAFNPHKYSTISMHTITSRKFPREKKIWIDRVHWKWRKTSFRRDESRETWKLPRIRKLCPPTFWRRSRSSADLAAARRRRMGRRGWRLWWRRKNWSKFWRRSETAAAASFEEGQRLPPPRRRRWSSGFICCGGGRFWGRQPKLRVEAGSVRGGRFFIAYRNNLFWFVLFVFVFFLNLHKEVFVSVEGHFILNKNILHIWWILWEFCFSPVIN